MDIEEYLASHLRSKCTLFKTDADGVSAHEWRVYQSRKNSKPNGDSQYPGAETEPFWNYARPFWLLPVSDEAKEKAILLFDQQSDDLDEVFDEDLSGVGISIDGIIVHPGREPFPEPDPSFLDGDDTPISFYSSMKRLLAGRWFKLDETLCVWIGVNLPTDQVHMEFDLPASIIQSHGSRRLVVGELRTAARGFAVRVCSARPDGSDRKCNQIFRWDPSGVVWVRESATSQGELIAYTLDDPGSNQKSLIYERFSVPRPHLGHNWLAQVNVFQNASSNKIRVTMRVNDALQLQHFWNDHVNQATKEGLDQVKRGANVSAAPNFSFLPSGSVWEAQYDIAYSGASLMGCGYSVRLTSHSPVIDGVIAGDTWLTFPSVKSVDGKDLTLKANAFCRSEGNDQNTSVASDNGTIFEFFVKDVELADGAENENRLRDGSLEFALADSVEASNWATLPFRMGRFRIVFQTKHDREPFFPWNWQDNGEAPDDLTLSYSVEELRIGVSDVSPAGQDPLPEDQFVSQESLGAVSEGAGYRREPPLLIPVRSSVERESTDARYFLVVNESINAGQSQRVDFRIERLPEFNPEENDLGELSAVVFDPSPQFFCKVNSRFLNSETSDTGGFIVARRSPISAERDGWEILDDDATTSGYQIVLPSQGLGEEVIKGTKPIDGEDVFDARFGAPAVLTISPERLQRRFVAVPWNLRRIWGQAGENSPGAPLIEAEFELLYGLNAKLNDENTYISELGAKLGELPAPSSGVIQWVPSEGQQDHYTYVWQRYMDAYRLWISRIAVLEPWSSDPFESYETDSGIVFRARVAVNPTNDDEPFGAQLRLPEFPDTSGLRGFDKIAKYHSSDGLKGGFHYGFESAAIYMEFVRSWDRSSSGEIKELSFSSVGGWGKQTARFAQDKSVIQSTTRMGRTNVYAVERIGRIGVFWNKAKHVILYERSVVPTKQFGGDQGCGDDSEPQCRMGRPILRKVKEYVEILEPERHYPDFETSSLSEGPGVVKSCFFPGQIIPVSSSWGSTVFQSGERAEYDAIGWQVPLWRVGSNSEVYPKPQVLLQLSAPDSAVVESLYVNIEDPQWLYFYTDVRESVDDVPIDSNVHAWPEIEGVDFINQPDPDIDDIEPSVGRSLDTIDDPLPDALPAAPGFERFTFRTKPSELPSDVAGSYLPKAQLTGKLINVTMMRGVPSSGAPERWWSGDGLGANGRIARRALDAVANSEANSTSLLTRSANGFANTIKSVRNGNALNYESDIQNEVKRWIQGDVGRGYKEVRQTLKELRSASNVVQPKLTLFNAGELATLWETPSGYTALSTTVGQLAWREAIEAGDSLGFKMISEFDSAKKGLVRELDQVISETNGSLSELVSTADRRLDQFSAQMKKVTGFPDWQLAKFRKTTLETVEHWRKQGANSIARILKQANLAIDSIPRSDDITTTKEKAKVAAQRARASILDFLDLLDNQAAALPDPLKQYILDVTSTLRGTTNEFAAQTEAWIDSLAVSDTASLRASLKSRLDSLSQSLVNEFNKELDALAKLAVKLQTDLYDSIGGNALSAKLAFVESEIATLVDEAKEILDTTTGTAAGLKTKIDNKLGELRVALASSIKEQLFNLLRHSSGPTVGDERIYDYVLLADGYANEIGSLFVSNLLEFFGIEDEDEFAQNVEDFVDAFASARRLKQAIESTPPDVEAIVKEATNLANDINPELGRLAGEVAAIGQRLNRLENTTGELVQSGKNVIRNTRSLWNEFSAPGLGFNRETLAMVVRFDPNSIEERLGITPCIAKAKEFQDTLEGMGVRLPIVGIGDDLLPAAKEYAKKFTNSLVEQFDFTSLMSDIGGIRLDNLFPGFKMPAELKDNIKITHGFDKEKLSAWVKAESDIKFKDRKTILPFGPLKVDIDKAHFEAVTRIEVDASGRKSKIAKGKLSGDLYISVGGMTFVIFKKMAIRFEGDKLHFDLEPRNVESPGLLKLLTDASKAMSSEADGFKVGVLSEGNFPVGMRADLNIGPFDVGGGVSSITGLLVGSFLELRALTPELKFDFLVGSGFNLGRKESPFNITIFILGGGGYFDVAFLYKPKGNELTVDVELSVHASASLVFSVGWMKGGVAIYLGLIGTYHKKPNLPASFSVSIFVLFTGHVDVLGLISAYLKIMLEATYKSLPNGGYRFQGTGTVKLTIRICRFIKIKVNRSFTKVIAEKKGSAQEEAIAESHDYELDYLTMLN